MRSTRTALRRLCTVLVAGAVVAATPMAAHAAAPYPSDAAKPDPIALLAGYSDFWTAAPGNTLKGQVQDAPTLERDDRLTVWINRHATKAQRFLALQDAEYQNSAGTAYDQSVTISTGLGSKLGALYVKGRNSGALPLTSALINSSNGTAGAYVGTGDAKAYFSHPRPYLPTDPTTPAVAGDDAACSPTTVNASSQRDVRVGQPWADARGNLAITRVPAVTDTTKRFSPNAVTLDAGYGTAGICKGGSFPSGHTTTAYQAGITLATLVPELAPEVLARASEAGNDRIVLGVHYPLDIMGGRINGEAALAARWSDTQFSTSVRNCASDQRAALAARWSDTQFRTEVLEPARAELVRYLQKGCGRSLTRCITGQKAYASNPYGGQALPGGTAQIVTNRKSAVKVYTERLTYGFARTGTRGLAASVPDGAENLLRTAFPALTAKQRTSVLAQTELPSGYPLDGTGTKAGAWQRLNLGAAMSATVKIGKNGSVKVVSVGGKARVVRH